jgi:hypothetical protein
VEKELRNYVERKDRLEKLRLEKEEFELAQREKGLVKFEGGWLTPLEREEVLLHRKERLLELDRKRVQLAREENELEKERIQTDRARFLLEGEENRNATTIITYGSYSPYRRTCITPVPKRHDRYCTKDGINHSTLQTSCNKSVIYKPGNNPYISTEGVSAYNRGPFNR